MLARTCILDHANRTPVEGTHITHNTVDIAVFIVQLAERTPIKELTVRYFESAVDRKFPGLDLDQLHAARKLAVETMKAAGR